MIKLFNREKEDFNDIRVEMKNTLEYVLKLNDTTIVYEYGCIKSIMGSHDNIEKIKRYIQKYL